VGAVYNPEPEREKMRGRLALGLVALLAVVIVSSLVFIALNWATVADIKTLLDTIMSPLVALAGTALGFYFGGRSKE
jgi:hypothetical protein